MSLKDEARATLRAIMNDDLTAFAVDVVITSPAGQTPLIPLRGRTQDIGQSIDPSTGMVVSGRVATVALCLDDLQAAGFPDLPRAIAEKNSKPWLVTIGDLSYKVDASSPDRSLGVIVLHLEYYRAASNAAFIS